MSLERMMTTTQVARLLGAETEEELRTRQRYLAQLRFRGQGPRFVKHGRLILYRESAIDEWIKAGETTCTRTLPGDIRGEAGSVAWRLACIILAVLQAVAAGACLDALLGLPADASPWLSIAYAVGTVTLWLAAVGVASLAVGGHGARHGRHCDEEEDR